VVRLNLLLLMVVSFIPFPTRLLAEYAGDGEPGRVSTTIYGVTLLLAAVLVSVLWRDVVREGLVRADAADEEVRTLTTRLTPSLAGSVAMIAVGLVAPVAAVLGYFVIALYLLVPFGAIRQHWSRH
jgi:uncharacterized membrane protein